MREPETPDSIGPRDERLPDPLQARLYLLDELPEELRDIVVNLLDSILEAHRYLKTHASAPGNQSDGEL